MIWHCELANDLLIAADYNAVDPDDDSSCWIIALNLNTIEKKMLFPLRGQDHIYAFHYLPEHVLAVAYLEYCELWDLHHPTEPIYTTPTIEVKAEVRMAETSLLEYNGVLYCFFNNGQTVPIPYRQLLEDRPSNTGCCSFFSGAEPEPTAEQELVVATAQASNLAFFGGRSELLSRQEGLCLDSRVRRDEYLDEREEEGEVEVLGRQYSE